MFTSIDEARKLPSPMRFPLLVRLSAFASSVLEAMDRNRWRCFVISLPAVIGLHIYAAGHTIRHSNQDRTRGDQGAEIWLAKTSSYYGDLWPRQSDGVRHPMWSWIARSVSHPDDQVFFTNGKWLNTAICCAFLGGLGFFANRTIGPLACANLLLLASLGVLMVRGTYFQPEPTYYIFSFGAMVCAWQILQRRSWWWYPVFGVLAGFSYLSKPSFEPFLVVFAASLGLRLILDRDLAAVPAAAAGGLAAILLMGAMVTPLFLYKKEHFGAATFGYPKYWMWMDDFETEAWPWQDRYPGRVQLEMLPAAETPSARWYFQRHTARDAMARLATGSEEVSWRFFFPERKRPGAFVWKTQEIKKWGQPLSHRGVYLLTILALAAMLAAQSWKVVLPELIRPANVACLAMVVGTAAFYLLLYGWYYPIGRGDRFMGSLWIPAVFLGCVLCRWGLEVPPPGLKPLAYLFIHGLILISLAIQGANLVFLFEAGIHLTTHN
jgi:hypothetical protein